ncbi:MAG: hypothetical protein ACRDAO_07960 [Culicoidibacterales bacterium]
MNKTCCSKRKTNKGHNCKCSYDESRNIAPVWLVAGIITVIVTGGLALVAYFLVKNLEIVDGDEE